MNSSKDLNPNANEELSTKMKELIDAAEAREGKPYAGTLAALYSMGTLCGFHPAFTQVGEQLLEGIGDLSNKEELVVKLAADFNAMLKITFSWLHKMRKENEPPST